MRTIGLAMIVALAAANPGLAADTDVAAALLRTNAQKQSIKNAINLRRSGLISDHSFRTYADAISKICTSAPITKAATSSKDSVSSALSLLSGTKDAIRNAIIGMGTAVPETAPFSAYATKIKAINCPGSPGFVDSGILTTNLNPEDDVDFQCANATVCNALSNATYCAANSLLFTSPSTCIGAPAASDWTLLYKCNSNCGKTGFPLTKGNIYRFDMRNTNCAHNRIYIPAHDTYIYSFQQQCNSVTDRPCLGMITAKNIGDPDYDYDTTSGNQWWVINEGSSCYNYITVPNTSAADILLDQPALSLWVYKLGT